MASVMFSTIGQAVGGPLAAAVGASVGASLDGALFAPKRGGLELQVQRSAYGDIVPRLFGRSRVAGQLIWALPMQSGAAKGSGRRTTGTSFAIALSARPILDIGRIWADGREIRDAEGRFEVATNMRVHGGGVSQSPDPLIEAAEAQGQALDYRGLAYVVFEDFGLGAYGNRIPNLSFEVIADSGEPGAWLAALGEEAGFSVSGPVEGATAVGFAATSSRVIDDADMLARTAGFAPYLAEGGFAFGGGRLFEIDPGDMLLRGESAPVELAVSARPAALSLGYFDPARDFQVGRQRISRGRSGVEIESGGALTATAEMAAGLAAKLLRDAETATETLSFGLPWRWMEIAVGDLIRLEASTLWRVVRRDIRGLALWFEAERVSGRPSVAAAADAGRSLAMPMVPAEATRLCAFETPVPLQGNEARLWVAAGGGGGWRGAEIRVFSGGDETSLGVIRDRQPSGTLMQPLEAGPEAFWDERNSLVLEQRAGDPVFESRDEASVLAGANLLIVGGELLQFQRSEAVGQRHVRLSRLLRGRFGSGYRMERVESGAFVMQLRPQDMLFWPIPADGAGREISLLAAGAGDPQGGTAIAHVVNGDGFGRIAPVHVKVSRLPDGTVQSSWIVRSRHAWEWDGEAGTEAGFRWCFAGDDGQSFEQSVASGDLFLTAAEQQARFGGPLPSGTCWVEVLGGGPIALRRSRIVRI